MIHRAALNATGLVAVSLVSVLAAPAHAALQGRDLDGNLATFEAYYDTDLNITWLADANYAQTSGYDADGLMYWAAANTWAAQLSFYNPLTNQTIDNWRLPTTTDMGAPGCTFVTNVHHGLDCGENLDPASSEMAHLYFTELGNLSYYTSTGAVSGAYAGGSNPNSTLDNVGPFINFQSRVYWSGTEYVSFPNQAWGFHTGGGYQLNLDISTQLLNALAVRPGDVAAVPEVQTYALMLAGLGLIGWRVRRRG